ncbi:MAG: GHKL domain-containing protein [Firmicutes bacterium]|nr:GHKL domain-containing protein [Bacillota bacterium]
MTLLMLLGAISFCIFMMLCIDNILAFKVIKKRFFLVDAMGIFIVAFVITVVSAFQLSTHHIHIIVASLAILLIAAFRSIPKAIAFIIYMKALFFSIDGATLLLLQLLGQSPARVWPTTLAITFVTWAAYYCLKRVLKQRVDMSIFGRKITLFLLVSAGVAVTFIYMNFANTATPIALARLDIGSIAYMLFFISGAVMFIIILRYVSKENHLRTEMLLVEASKKYIHDLEESYKALRTIKHDYVNILTSFKLYIDSGDITGLQKYYYGELSEINKELLNQDKLMGSLQNVDISEVKSILMYKASAAALQQVDVAVEALDPIESLGAPTVIVCQILGILMDNAIEAAVETDEKKLIIAIVKNQNSKSFIIKNTWQSKDIPMAKMFELGFSTKADGRGVGLHTARSYTEKIKGLYLQTETSQEFFTQTLTVKDSLKG